MNPNDILRMAREAGFNTDHDLICIEGWEISPYMQRFAALVAAEVDKNWVQGKAKINVPTMTMEQEFNNYHRLGYKAGAAAEREACARVCDEVETQGHALWKRTYDPDAQGRSTGAADCAAAIRARGEEPKRHPGYIIGDHWLQAAYTRICTGETEDEVMTDYGWQRARGEA